MKTRPHPIPDLADAVRADARSVKDALGRWHASNDYYNLTIPPTGPGRPCRQGRAVQSFSEQSATKASSLSPAAAICAACSAELAAFVMAEPSLRALTAASCQRIWAN
jgi:hypothetical protein